MNAKQSNYLKIGLIVVLAIVFVGAVANSAMSIRGVSPAPRSAPAALIASTQPAVAQPVSVSNANETRQGEVSDRVWPTFALEDIVAYNPFAVAKGLDVATVSKDGVRRSSDGKQGASGQSDDAKAAVAAVEASITGRIHAVYQRGGRTAALIGSKTVRPGDELEGAGRVVEVDQGGLMLEVKK